MHEPRQPSLDWLFKAGHVLRREVSRQPPFGDSYGAYILETGAGIVARHELLLGSYWYKKYFTGIQPILDLGPGRCWFTKQDVANIVAVDNSPEVVAAYQKLGINIVLGSAYEIPFPSAHFQAVFCCWLLEHLADPLLALREIHRVLKPGGQACVIVPTPDDMQGFYDDYTHIRPFTRVSLAQLADAAAFAKHDAVFLPWMRGIRQIIAYLGEGPAMRYLGFCDTQLRTLRIVNKSQLMLRAWK